MKRSVDEFMNIGEAVVEIVCDAEGAIKEWVDDRVYDYECI